MSKPIKFDLSKLTISWTKYDIVQVMDVISSEDRIDKYKGKKIAIDEPILRKFLGIKRLTDPTPDYWIKIQDYPEHKTTFALLALLFTHGRIINDFANTYSNSSRGGVFLMTTGERKEQTNIRSALVESGAASPKDRRSEKVTYNFSDIFTSGSVGTLFKDVLEERITRITKNKVSEKQFYEISLTNNFHKVLGLSFNDFHTWLEGNGLPMIVTSRNEWVEEVEIQDFFSIKNAVLDFDKCKEIYLLGENGDGKSLVLMATYLAFNGYYIKNIADSEPVAKVLDIVKKLKFDSLLGIDAAADANEYGVDVPSSISNFFAYGTHRGRYSTDKAEKYGFMSLFSIDQQLHNPETWLMQQKAIEVEKRQDEKPTLGDDEFYPARFSVSYLERLLNDILEKNVKIEVGVSRVVFREKGQIISFDQLSEGYRSVIIFVIDLMIRLTQTIEHNQVVDLKKVKGVVLIDEIDQHLHPKWQKEIVGRLRQIFPEVQFIMTTHSPTIIQGASDEAIIFRVFRDKFTGETKVSDPVYRKELDDLMVNSLVTHPIFGLETARLVENKDNADTSDDYLQYRISKNIREELDKKRKEGANFITDQEIDDLIKEIMKQELDNDKDR